MMRPSLLRMKLSFRDAKTLKRYVKANFNLPGKEPISKCQSLEAPKVQRLQKT